MLPLVVLFLPLVAFLTLAFFGRALSPRGATLLSTAFLFLALGLSAFLLYSVGIAGHAYLVDLAPWMAFGLFAVNFTFLVDPLTVTMFFVVTFVSSLVHLYSTEYMAEDPHLTRFMSYLSLFTFFMLLLVSSGNFLLLFFGWEGVGICSYLLINFWYTRQEANRSALKAVVMNRIGDCGLILALVLVYYVFRTLDFLPVFATAPALVSSTLPFLGLDLDFFLVLSLALLLAVLGKSAQLGLHTWLPDAMEGPTPVSALIHAATMVTAGVYLLVRCSPIFENSEGGLLVVALVGVLTMLFGSLCAVAQYDMKKLIAYSTASQLGYMVFACGLSQYHLAMFHLFNHAFFKALLFLAAGSVIHGLAGEQDMRRMGGLRALMPVTYAFILVASLSLAAFPFTAGYFSKEAIIENAPFADPLWGGALYWLGLLGSLLTTYYSTKLLYLVFWRRPEHGYESFYRQGHESSATMLTAMYPLAILSIFSGYLFADLFVGPGTYFWSNAIHGLHGLPAAEHHFFLDAGSPLGHPTVAVFLGLVSCLWLQRKSTVAVYVKNFRWPPLVKPTSWTSAMVALYRLQAKRFHFDDLYNRLVAGSFFSAPRSLASALEQHRLDGASVQGYVSQGSLTLAQFHQGTVTSHIQFMFLFLALALAFGFYGSGSVLATLAPAGALAGTLHQGRMVLAGRVSAVSTAVHDFPPSGGLGSNSLAQEDHWLWVGPYLLALARSLVWVQGDLVPLVQRPLVSLAPASRRTLHGLAKALGLYHLGTPFDPFLATCARNHFPTGPLALVRVFPPRP